MGCPADADLDERGTQLVQGGVQKITMSRRVNPAARARWMRQRNAFRHAANVLDGVHATNDLVERQRPKKPVDRKTSDWNQQLRTNDAKLIIQPHTAFMTFRG